MKPIFIKITIDTCAYKDGGYYLFGQEMHLDPTLESEEHIKMEIAEDLSELFKTASLGDEFLDRDKRELKRRILDRIQLISPDVRL